MNVILYKSYYAYQSMMAFYAVVYYSFADIVLTVLRKYWLPPLKPVVPQYKIHLWWILTLR